MKFRILLLISLLALISVCCAQPEDKDAQPEDKDDKDDKNDVEDADEIDDPSAPPSVFEFDITEADSNITEPSELPTSSPTNPAPSLVPLPPTDSPTVSSQPTSSPTASRVPTSSPTASRVPTSSPTASRVPTSSPTASTEPSSSPTTSTGPSSSPSAAPVTPPLEDCAGQSCDIEDSDACSCRPGLECRQRGVEQFICSQVSRTERTRLSTSLGIGGAAGRDPRARVPNPGVRG